MVCPKCGTENKPKFKFCVKCGSNLEDPGNVNIEQVDMGGYRSEDDYASDKNSFKIGSGTFTISDRAPTDSMGMFTADELNDTDEEFDFSSFDEPYIPKLDADRIAVPANSGDTMQKQQMLNNQGNLHTNNPNGAPGMFGYQQPMNGMPNPQQPVNGMAGMQAQPPLNGMPNPQPPLNGMQNPQQPVNGMAGMQGQQPMNGMQNPQQPVNGMPAQNANPYANQMYAGQPMYGAQQMMAPQIIGYDQNGMPIYSQPQQVMYAPPQIVGYDQNGMPIYGQPQPVMYAPPQIIGYDQNGMPVYGQPQPVMYAPPVMNENGEYVQQPYPMPQNGMPYGAPAAGMNMQGMQPQPPMNNMYGAVQPQQQAPAQNAPAAEPVKVSNNFWNNFFSDDENEGNDKNSGDDEQDDFFSKPRPDRSNDMGNVNAEGMDINRLKKHERKKNAYMTATPDVDASALQPNQKDELNKRYMRQTMAVDADQLEAKKLDKPKDIMNATSNVNAEELETFERKKTRITMSFAGEANHEELQTFEREHKASLMDQANKAVEALPKKKAVPADDIDAIELPEYMQARKTIRSESPAIPGLPEL